MKPKLLEWLWCPDCHHDFALEAFRRQDAEVQEGVLRCACGAVYPIVEGIPRILEDSAAQFPEFARVYAGRLGRPAQPPSERGDGTTPFHHAQGLTQRSFGFQWTMFSDMSESFQRNFLNYVFPLQPAFFQGRLGLDAGCGFGRHLYYAASFGAEMVGVDFSRAIDAAHQNTKSCERVHLIQADMYRLPLKPAVFDFAYSVGVLHHLPDPEEGFRQLPRLVKPSAPVLIWLYSSRRRVLNRLLEGARRVTRRLNHRVLYGICWLAAAVEWVLFIRPCARLMRRRPTQAFAQRLFPARIHLYAQYPFQVSHADWFDRLAAPLRHYYDAPEVSAWLERAGLTNIRVTPTGLYGWRGYGERVPEGMVAR